MLRLFVFAFLTVWLCSCGVETSSSATKTDSGDSPIGDLPVESEDDGLENLNLIDPNPLGAVDNDTNLGDLDLIDLNPITTDPDPDPDPDPDLDPSQDPSQDPGYSDSQIVGNIFDTKGAILDELACLIGEYTNNIISDTSIDPVGAMDQEDGIGINSQFTYNDVLAKTEVKLYYSDLKPQRTLDSVNIYEDDYRITVDTGWATNDDTVIYVKTPLNKDDLYGCYRFELEGIDKDSKIVATKVYR